eukprot:59127-Chlamydomonas_euryale.AAC.1
MSGPCCGRRGDEVPAAGMAHPRPAAHPTRGSCPSRKLAQRHVCRRGRQPTLQDVASPLPAAVLAHAAHNPPPPILPLRGAHRSQPAVL